MSGSAPKPGIPPKSPAASAQAGAAQAKAQAPSAASAQAGAAQAKAQAPSAASAQAGAASAQAGAAKAKAGAKAPPKAPPKGAKGKAAPAKPVRVVTVSSGKGGVGKSNITLALALALAELGRKVLIWDADLGLANADVLLGIRTQFTIHHWLKGEKSLREIIVKGPKGISILPAASGILELNVISESQKARLIAEFEQWQDDLDFLLIDTAAGIGPNVIFFNLVAQEHLVVLNNEPTSLTDAYALIKSLCVQHKQLGFYLLPNMVEGQKEARAVFQLMSEVAGKFLDQVSLDLIGFIPYDESVQIAVRRQSPFYILFPDSPASLAVLELAKRLISLEPPSFGAGGLVLFLNRLVAAERAVD